MALQIFDFDDTEERFSIDKIHPMDNEWGLLFNKNLSMYEAYTRFWQPRRDMGKKCMNYARRNIFTSGQRDKYEKIYGKIPIEPQEMIYTINGLSSQIMKMVQNSYITTEDETPPPNAASSEDMNTVVSWWKDQLRLGRKKKKALRNGLITGYPQWVWFDLVNSDDNINKVIKASILPWDSTMPHFWFDEEDGSDIYEMVRFTKKTKAELLDMFPEREDQFREFEKLKNDTDSGFYSQLFNISEDHTSEDRKDLIYNALTTSLFSSMDGIYFVIHRDFVVKKKQVLQINENTGDAQILPKNWTRERKDEWVSMHPEYTIERTMPVRTLWTTTISSDGMIWENNEHWFQENGMLPGCCYIPDMVDNIPMGVGENMLPYILGIAVSETEGLHQVRTGSGTTTFIREGTVRNPSTLGEEMAKENGVVFLKKNAPKDSVVVEKKTPNTTFIEYSDRQRAQLKDVHRVNDSIMGATHPRQSSIAKEKEIVQGMAPQSPFVENYSDFDNRLTQMLCNLMPYGLNEERIIEIKDEFGRPVAPVQINAQGFDPNASGKAKILANDVTTVKYRVVIEQGDSSKTSREQQLKEFVEIINAIGNTLFQLPPNVISFLFMSFPNRYAQETGRHFQVEAKQQAEAQQAQLQAEQQTEMQTEVLRRKTDLAKINTPKFDIKLTPEEIEQNPLGTKVLLDLYQQKQQETKAEMAAA